GGDSALCIGRGFDFADGMPVVSAGIQLSASICGRYIGVSDGVTVWVAGFDELARVIESVSGLKSRVRQVRIMRSRNSENFDHVGLLVRKLIRVLVEVRVAEWIDVEGLVIMEIKTA